MPKKILWLENDTFWIIDTLEELREQNIDVQEVAFVSIAEQKLNTMVFDLVIIDVMIPVWDHELKDYPPSLTERGHMTGLHFYRRNKTTIDDMGAKVMVYSVRGDADTMLLFKDAGLEDGCFFPRYNLSDMNVLVGKIRALLNE